LSDKSNIFIAQFSENNLLIPCVYFFICPDILFVLYLVQCPLCVTSAAENIYIQYILLNNRYSIKMGQRGREGDTVYAK
jgi:hypothetical protein